MVSHFLRFLKRFAVLIPGLIIAYLSIRDIFPIFDKRLPGAVAVFLTYVVAAYILIPALLRLYRMVIPARHLPLYCVTPDGFASDPINIGLIGSRAQLVAAMQAAGWHVADPHTPRHLLHAIYSILLRHPYPTSPMSNLYLFGRKHDVGFEIPLGDSRGHRHHVRFWATTYQNIDDLSLQTIHWHHRKEQLKGDDLLWVGAASRDVGFALIRHNVQISHMIHPDTDAERELIVRQLLGQKVAKSVTAVHLGKPYRLVNRVWRGYLQSDGMMRVLKLR